MKRWFILAGSVALVAALVVFLAAPTTAQEKEAKGVGLLWWEPLNSQHFFPDGHPSIAGIQNMPAATRTKVKGGFVVKSEVGRSKVPGGWLIVMGSNMTFYPDPKHTWDGGSME